MVAWVGGLGGGGGGVFILKNRSTPSPPYSTTIVLELDGREHISP